MLTAGILVLHHFQEYGFQRAIEINPTEARFHSNLGSIYVQAAEYEKAVPVFQRAMELSPEDGIFKKNRDGAMMQMNVNHFRRDLLAGNVTHAKSIFTGENYTNSNEIVTRMVVEAYPDTLPVLIAVMKEAIAEVPNFAITRHVLSDFYFNLVERRTATSWEQVREIA